MMPSQLANDEKARKAIADYEAALKPLGRMPSSDALSKRNNAEARYALSYQRLVRMGLRPQIRGKYRP